MSHESRKPPDYCRPHGRRIIIFLNGIGGCRKCCDQLIEKMQQTEGPDESELSTH